MADDNETFLNFHEMGLDDRVLKVKSGKNIKLSQL